MMLSLYLFIFLYLPSLDMGFSDVLNNTVVLNNITMVFTVDTRKTCL